MVSAKEELDLPVSPAMDALMRVHKRIIDVDTDSAPATSGAVGTVITRILVADTQAGSLIGKQGSTVKSIQDASNCTIRVLSAEHLPNFVLQDDSVVEVQGEPAGVHKAVELILNHLRKFLVDRSIVGVFEMQMQMPKVQANQNIPPHQSWGPQGFPINAGAGPGFATNPQYMQHPRQYDNYYSPAEMPPLDNQHRQGPMYGRDASVGAHLSSVQLQQLVATKVTHHMQIPLLYADAVIGISGANISYIRRVSGATIAIQETMGVPEEMTIEINGSASQVQTAEQLIQNFMAEAASSTHTQNPAGGSISQGYNAYPSYGPSYASPLPTTAGHTGHAPAPDYGLVYGNNFGY